MDVQKQIDYWLTTAETDISTAKTIYQSGKNFHYALFFCHLTLEKYLKALVVKKTEKYPPRIHDLELLAEKAELRLDDDKIHFLREMTVYNLDARYPDEQYEIYKRANGTVAELIINQTEEYLKWMKELLK